MKRFLASTLFLLPALTAFGQLGQFGSDVTAFGDLVLVSAISQDGGSLILFSQSEDGQWERTGTLTAPDAEDVGVFGYSSAVHGPHLLVGSPSAPDSEASGMIYLMEYDAETGALVEVGRIMGPEGEHIGGSITVMGDMMATSGLMGTTVSVFSYTGTTFESVGSVEVEAAEDGTPPVLSTAMDSERLYVGAGNTEAVHVYNLSDFSHQSTLTYSGEEAVEGFGYPVVSAGDGMLLVGAPGLVPNTQPMGPPPAGVVFLYEMNDERAWSESQMISGESESVDLFGFSMDASESSVLIGAALADEFKGQVHEYTPDEKGEWVLSSSIDSEESQSLLGMALIRDGDMLAVTASGGNGGAGTVHIYQATEGGWSHVAELESGLEAPGPLEEEEAEIEMVATTESYECADSLARDFGCENVDLLAFVPLSDLGAEDGVSAADIWGWTDAESGSEYAILARSNGTSFIDITNPSTPVFLGDLPMTEGSRAAAWRDVKVYNNHAFVVADNAGEHGMQVFDLTQLRDATDLPRTFEPLTTYDGIHSAHNVVINEETGYAFAVGSSGGGETCGGGLHMINIQDPANPVFEGCFGHEGTGRADTGYSHDAQCVIYNGPDTEHQGQEICFGSNETALSIADITDKDNPVALSSISYPNVAYAHQGWLTEDQQFFYSNDELDELGGEVVGTRTLVWDVSDLDDPVLALEYMSENLASDHNLYIVGDVMYQSNYKSGLRIFDISDRVNPTPIGFFDTFPGPEDDPGFAGTWSNYPFFESGTIIVSGIGEGLFVLKRRSVDI